MWFVVIATFIVIAFPTMMSSMAGYTPAVEAWIKMGDQGFSNYTNLYPIAFIIHDGERINLTADYRVPYFNEGTSHIP